MEKDYELFLVAPDMGNAGVAGMFDPNLVAGCAARPSNIIDAVRKAMEESADLPLLAVFLDPADIYQQETEDLIAALREAAANIKIVLLQTENCHEEHERIMLTGCGTPLKRAPHSQYDLETRGCALNPQELFAGLREKIAAWLNETTAKDAEFAA